MSRIQNVTTNAIYGLISNCLSMIVTFITRTIFIQTLGATFLGLNGLFTSILGVLSLADLGITSAITYSLYKPLSKKDMSKIGQIINLLGRCYKIIGIIILICGLSLLPFLKYLVNFPNGIEINFYYVYLLFLLNSVCTYLFFSYKNTVIYADQKSYLTTKYEMFYTILTLLLQIIILVFFENYYAYLIVPIIINIIKNYNISKISEKLFPVLKHKNNDQLSPCEKHDIFKNIYSIALIKVSGVVYTSTDNLLISAYINTIIAGYYSNYIMIINIIKGFINIIFNSVTASVGNLNALENDDYKYKVFKRLNLFNAQLYGFCASSLFHLLSPFIVVWIGEQYIFSNLTELLIVLTFLIPGMNNVINIYKDACGLFWETRFRTIVTAILNFFVSIILVQKLGINGVLLGTIVAYIFTIYIVDPIVVYRKVFHKSVLSYYGDLIKNFLFLLLVNLLLSVLLIKIEDSLYTLFIKLFIVVVVYFGVSFLFFYKNEEFKYYLLLLKSIIKNNKGGS